MKLLVALLFSLAAGWALTLPRAPANNHTGSNLLAGLPDGGYMIGFEADGTPYVAAHYPAPDPDDDGGNQTIPPAPASQGRPERGSSPPSHGAKVPETDDAWGCVETEFVDPATWTLAAANLAAWCDDASNMVEAKKILTWLQGDSEAYVCNWAGPQNCNGDEYWAYMARPIDYYCSPFHSGWVLKGADNKGYGRGVHGQRGESLQICFNP